MLDVAALKAAHRHSSAHKDELLSSEAAGCFSCVSTFPPSHIVEWVEETQGPLSQQPDPWTALCPECGIDAVIGSASGLPVNDLAFLRAMNKEWFGEDDAQD